MPSGSAKPRGLVFCRHAATILRSCHVNTSAFPDCGYTGTMAPVFSPTRSRMSTIGLVICSRDRRYSTRPKNAASVPSGSCFSRQPWLKNTTRR